MLSTTNETSNQGLGRPNLKLQQVFIHIKQQRNENNLKIIKFN